MTALTIKDPQRRGVCPGLSVPMATGDGLLVRLLPIGPIPLTAFAALCAAARIHGNGVLEVTARGSIQVRGLDRESAPRFAASVAALNIAAGDGIPVLSNPLAGLDATDAIDAAALAAELRRALAQKSLAKRLSAKVSVVIDGGGTLNLDNIAADVRLGAEKMASGVVALRVAVGGDRASATLLGVIAVERNVETVVRLLEAVAQCGARARDIVATERVVVLHSVVADLLIADEQTPTAAKPCDVIGTHALRDGSFAVGLGLAFGHADATSLEHLIAAAKAAGAGSVQPAARRALMAIGLPQNKLSAFAHAGGQLGFIVRADDPRRHVIACAGAPVCASAHIAARAIGPRIAAIAAPHIDGSFKIHVSGCAKGCAHPTRAGLTVVGAPDGCALVKNGSAREAPFAVVSADDLPNAVPQVVQQLRLEGGHG